MDLAPALLQFLGSLVAILALAGIALWLRLGPTPTLANEEEALAAADEAVGGFEPVAIALDANGHGALLRDATGQILLLRPHGTHLAGRMLTPAARMEIEGETLVIDTAEKRFGTARLNIADPSTWMRALEAIKGARNA